MRTNGISLILIDTSRFGDTYLHEGDILNELSQTKVALRIEALVGAEITARVSEMDRTGSGADSFFSLLNV